MDLGEAISGPIIPFAQLTAEHCSTLADSGEQVLKLLRSWNLKALPTTSLGMAVARLRQIGQAKSYGTFPGDYRLAAQAIETAGDWALIAQCLTQDPVAAIASELRIALETGATSAKAGNILSQFWFGALLAQADLSPSVPPPTGRRPDFMISLDTFEMSVEVKRPAAYGSAMRNIKDAVSQIRDFGRPGFVVLDLTPALGFDDLSTSLFEEPQLPPQVAGPRFLRAARNLSDRVRGYNQQGKWHRLLGLFTFARIHAWHRSNPRGPTMTVFFESPVFPDANFGLLAETSERVRRRFRAGLEQMTGTTIRELG